MDHATQANESAHGWKAVTVFSPEAIKGPGLFL